MKVWPTDLREVLIIEPKVFEDDRGFFLETYHELKYAEAGIVTKFVQDNYSFSYQHSLRGLHAQVQYPQGKLVRVNRGEIFDVAVDIRKGSPTFSQWVSVILSSDNFKQMYIPPGFAHGFCVLSERADVEYKCTANYHPQDEITILWNDETLKIDWPIERPTLSDKDRLASNLNGQLHRLPIFQEAAE